ncbi:MAG: DNA glycosylase AlkZ-like family protein, partial [Actinomycetota bacterium]
MTRLDRRALNRALLERHMLLRRRPRMAPLAAVDRLVGMQAQVPRDPYVGLWARLDGFKPSVLSRAMEERRAVRMTLFRGTLHLVSSRDAVALRPLLQPVVERSFSGQRGRKEAMAGVDRRRLLTFIRRQLEKQPLTRAELTRAIEERWPGSDANALAFALYLLPTVQVTPRGLWGASGRSAFTTVERWLGRRVSARASIDDLVLRYLETFGPATPADAQYWS